MEDTKIEELTTDLEEFICDEICKHSCRSDITQDTLEDICAECKVMKYTNEIINKFNEE